MNYRLLQVGEVIRQGDEFLWPDGQWCKTIRMGGRVTLDRLGSYRREEARPVKAVENSVTISRRDAKKLFKLAKDHCKREIEDNEWRFGPDNDEQEWRTFLKALRKLEKETLSPK